MTLDVDVITGVHTDSGTRYEPVLQSIPRVAADTASRTSDLRLSEEQQLQFLCLPVVVNCCEIRVQASDVTELHF